MPDSPPPDSHRAETGGGKGSKPRKRAPRRSAARVAAVQALYQIDVTGGPAEGVLDEFVRFRLSGGRSARAAAEAGDVEVPGEADRALFLDVVRGVSARRDAIDEILGGALTEKWTVARLDPVLRATLRAGVYELFARDDIPAKVSISEYVDVAHAFFEGRESGLVNGVLDRIAKRLSGEEPRPADPDAPDSSPPGESPAATG